MSLGECTLTVRLLQRQDRGGMRSGSFIALVVIPLVFIGHSIGAAGSLKSRPEIKAEVKESILTKVIKDREIAAHASLEDAHRYYFYTSMAVNASPEQAQKVLTEYPLYEKMVPFVKRAVFDSKTQTLDVSGGVWNYMLRSWVKFLPESPKWVNYEIVQGHFKGLTGKIVYEDLPDGKALILFTGILDSKGPWPPAFIVERGAELVFTYTARRMRSEIESRKKLEFSSPVGKERHGPVPLPQHKLPLR